MFADNSKFDFIPFQQDVILRYHDDNIDMPLAWQQQVNAYWRKQQSINPHLFDAKIVILLPSNDIRKTVINVSAVDYRYIYAYRHHIRHQDIRLYTVGVVGIIHCDDGAIIGQRATHSGLMPLFWEFIPAGGVDLTHLDDNKNINPKNNIIDEAREELDLPVRYIGDINICGILQYHHIDMIEIIYNMRVNLSFAKIQQYARLPEHQDIKLYDRNFHQNTCNKVPCLEYWLGY